MVGQRLKKSLSLESVRKAQAKATQVEQINGREEDIAAAISAEETVAFSVESLISSARSVVKSHLLCQLS